MMDFDETHFEKYRVQAGDILVSEGQSPELVGQSAIFEEFAEDLCFQKTLHRFRADPFVTSHRFAQLVFRANVASGVFKRLASITTNIAHLTLEKFSASPFPLPPLGEQNAIVERADELFSGTKAVDTQVRDGLRIAAAQRQNILRAAFAGQLVPQDPNDEPASVLLERIRAGRQNAQAHGRRKSAVVRHSKEETC
jgi:type I restriction enzyme S subunit